MLVEKNDRNILGNYWFRAFSEASLILTSMIALSWYIPSFWLPWQFVYFALALTVLIIALRYEPPVAYCMGALAALGYACYFWFHSDIVIYPPLPTPIIEGGMLLLIATLTSDIVRVRLQPLHTLEQRYSEVSGYLRKALRQKQTLHILYTDLERQLEEQNRLVMQFSEQLNRLWHIRGAHRYTAILRMLTGVITPGSGALYLRRGNEMRLCTQQHIRADQYTRYAPALNIYDPLIANVIRKGQVNTVRNEQPDEQTQINTVGSMIGPLRNSDGAIVGIILMSGMPMAKLTPSLVRLFNALLQLTARTLNIYDTPEPTTQDSDYPNSTGLEDDTDPVMPAIKNTQALPEV